MTTVSLPSWSLPSSYFCAPHRSITYCFFLFVCVTSVWWECISYRCLHVLTVHTYILEILIFASVVRNRIPVHHGTICAGRPWEQSSTCQWARPALCCCTHGTDCSAASLTSHSLDNPVSVVPWTSQLPIPASSMACADRHPCWVMDTASPALHSKSSSWLVLFLLFWSWAKAGCKGKALLPYIHNSMKWLGTCHLLQDWPKSEARSKVKNVWAASSPCWTLTTPRCLPAPQQLSEPRQQRLEAEGGG